MSIFSSKKSSSSSSVTNRDERIAASDFANVVQADGGSTINFGLAGSELAAALNLRESPRLEAERQQLAETLAGIGGAGQGISGQTLLLIGGGLLLFFLLRG